MASSEVSIVKSARRKASLNLSFSVKKQTDGNHKKISKILQKPEGDRTPEDLELLLTSASIVKEVKLRLERRKKLSERATEKEDSPLELEEKCLQLAEAIRRAEHLVVYSGAGVSTAAKIPDYRGTNGIWTRLQQGKDIGAHDLSTADPTAAHMALSVLYRKGLLKYIVSQNCDGLHLRSGLPRWALSELHGNMNLEVCTPCNIEVWRKFDVTQHTARYAHKTARRCGQCGEPLRDTIVHFGERGSLAWPINWAGACQAAKQADVILCMGSSLKVLKRYPWLWGMDKPVKKRPQLYIVNLQWTPKDDQATLKINGKCDDVMRLVMKMLRLEIPCYERRGDPIFWHATGLHPLEEHTTATQILSNPEEERIEEIVSDIKKEKELWRPYHTGHIEICPGQPAAPPSPPSPNTGLGIDLFDRMYREIAQKVLRQTDDLDYYAQFYSSEPLDLSKPKTECDFCYQNYSAKICQFYKAREVKVKEEGGPACYCCDSEDEQSPPQESGGVSESANSKPPQTAANPGWFGKGYRKKIKKKR